MHSSFWTKASAFIVVVVLILMMTAHQVRFTETAVVTRFDKVVREIPPTDAGLKFRWPWPIDRVHKFDARLRNLDTEFTQLSTEDQKTITVSAFATWRIEKPLQFLKAVGKDEAAATKIGDLLKNQVSNVLRRYPLTQLVNVDASQMKFDQIERDILAGIRAEALSTYGIGVASVGIKRLGLPEANTKEVFERMKADRQKQIDSYVAEGDARAKQIRSDAEQVANRILSRAEEYAKKLRGEGDARAAQYYAEYEKSAELSAFLKKLESLAQILKSGNATVIFDASKDIPFDVLRDPAAPAAKPAPASEVKP